MAYVRTILGDVDPATLGVVDSHDHLIRVGAGEVYIDADHQLDSVEKAQIEAGYFVDASLKWSSNGGTVVDMCPINCGRNPEMLAEVARSVNHLQVIAATGFHREHVYLETQFHWVNRYTAEQIADLVIADIREGIDQNDYSGPICRAFSPIRQGLLRLALPTARLRRLNTSAWKQLLWQQSRLVLQSIPIRRMAPTV